MKKKIKLNKSSFFRLPKEEQASRIEEDTKRIIGRLPELKANLKMYGEVSDELYNLSADELELIGTTYSRAIRGGEITTPSSKKAYNDFVRNLRKYARTPIKILAEQTALQRMENWLNTIKTHASAEEIAYVERMVNDMTIEQKIGFTRSKYFLDNEKWNSLDTFIIDVDEGMFSIQTLKLELYLEDNWGKTYDSIYMREIASVSDIKDLREYHLKRHKHKKNRS